MGEEIDKRFRPAVDIHGLRIVLCSLSSLLRHTNQVLFQSPWQKNFCYFNAFSYTRRKRKIGIIYLGVYRNYLGFVPKPKSQTT